MVYDVKVILQDVRVAMDENKTNEQLIEDEDIDTLTLDEIIRSKILEGVRMVVNAAPIHLLEGGITFGDAVYWTDQYSGYVLLPDYFLRLMIFKMSDWERPVYTAITESDPTYQLQHSRYKGIRGNPQRPVVAIVRRQEGLILEFYSCESDEATVEQGMFMAMPLIDKDGMIEIPEKCYRAVVYVIASLVYSTLGKADYASVMTELSNQLLV